jgi:hypothetical protein
MNLARRRVGERAWMPADMPADNPAAWEAGPETCCGNTRAGSGGRGSGERGREGVRELWERR